tara:strand:+ start:303 stop:1196 length:894 start_codon:yes stop_codon:yes gene_type:complete
MIDTVSFRLNIGNEKEIVMQSGCHYARDRLAEAIEEDRAGAVFGNTWKLATAFALSGADWAAWSVYHTKLRSKYNDLIRGPEYRDSFWETDRERKAIMWNRIETAQSCARYTYIPESIGLPQFIEGPPVKAQWIRKFLDRRSLPRDVEVEWFLRSYDSQQITIGPNLEFAPSTWQLMINAGLVAKNGDIPPKMAAKALSMKDLRQLLDACGIAPEKSIAAACNAFSDYGQSDPKAAIERLRAQIGNRDIYMLKPPTGIAWQDFQSWRQQLRGIATAVTDIYVGDLRAISALCHNSEA